MAGHHQVALAVPGPAATAMVVPVSTAVASAVALRCCPDADMRHHAVEAVIEEQLFPPKLSSQVRGLPSHLLS